MSHSNPSAAQKNTIALFTYGGGLRGLIPAHIMGRIEERTGLRMADMVDIFTGPSTGSILNAALTLRHAEHTSSPRFRARHMVKFYEREGHKIFPPDRFREFRGIVHDFNNRTLKLNQLNALFRHGHYDPANLGRALKALYGDARLSDSLRTLVIPTYNLDGEQLKLLETTEVDSDNAWVARGRASVSDYGGHALWLSNIRHMPDIGPSLRTPDVSMYDAVMASTAAPTYFPCHHFKARYPGKKEINYTGIDGSIFDNPCISYLGAIRRLVPEGNKLTMLVLGTGDTNRAIKRDQWNSYGALGVVDPVNDLPLINIFFHASESALMESFVDDLGRDLFVFNKSMINPDNPNMPSTQIDDASPENFDRLRVFAEELMEEQKSKLDDICHILASNRDRREEEQRRNTLGDRVKKYFTFFGDREIVE